MSEPVLGRLEGPLSSEPAWDDGYDFNPEPFITAVAKAMHERDGISPVKGCRYHVEEARRLTEHPAVKEYLQEIADMEVNLSTYRGADAQGAK